MGLTSQVSVPENLASSGDHCQESQFSQNNLAHIMPVLCRLPLRLIIDSMKCEVSWCPTVQLVVTTEAMMTTTTNGTYLLHFNYKLMQGVEGVRAYINATLVNSRVR